MPERSTMKTELRSADARPRRWHVRQLAARPVRRHRGGAVKAARASDGMVVAHLGAVGIQSRPVAYDTRRNPTAWALPGLLYLVDTGAASGGRRLYVLSRARLGFAAMTKRRPLSVAVELAAVLALPPGERAGA